MESVLRRPWSEIVEFRWRVELLRELPFYENFNYSAKMRCTIIIGDDDFKSTSVVKKILCLVMLEWHLLKEFDFVISIVFSILLDSHPLVKNTGQSVSSNVTGYVWRFRLTHNYKNRTKWKSFTFKYKVINQSDHEE